MDVDRSKPFSKGNQRETPLFAVHRLVDNVSVHPLRVSVVPSRLEEMVGQRKADPFREVRLRLYGETLEKGVCGKIRGNKPTVVRIASRNTHTSLMKYLPKKRIPYCAALPNFVKAHPLR